MTLLEDPSHLVVLDESCWSANRGEWHEKKDGTGEGSYWIELTFEENRCVRLEYSEKADRDATWEMVKEFFNEEFGG